MPEPCKNPDCNRFATKSGYCFYCDPDVPASEKRRARIKGGKAARRIEPMSLNDLPESIDDVCDLKALLMSVLKATVDGTITTTESRTLVAVASAIKDALELGLYQELAERLTRLESGKPPDQLRIGGRLWQVQELESGDS